MQNLCASDLFWSSFVLYKSQLNLHMEQTGFLYKTVELLGILFTNLKKYNERLTHVDAICDENL